MLDFQGVYVSAAASELGQVQDTWGRHRTPGADAEHLEHRTSVTARVEANLWPFGSQALVVMSRTANAQMVSHQQFPHLICLSGCAEDLLKITASPNHSLAVVADPARLKPPWEFQCSAHAWLAHLHRGIPMHGCSADTRCLSLFLSRRIFIPVCGPSSMKLLLKFPLASAGLGIPRCSFLCVCLLSMCSALVSRSALLSSCFSSLLVSL